MAPLASRCTSHRYYKHVPSISLIITWSVTGKKFQGMSDSMTRFLMEKSLLRLAGVLYLGNCDFSSDESKTTLLDPTVNARVAELLLVSEEDSATTRQCSLLYLRCNIVDHLQGSFGPLGLSAQSPKKVSKMVSGPLGPCGAKSQKTESKT